MLDSQVIAFAAVAAFARSAMAFTAMKIAGACYLAWLGIQSLHSSLRETATASVPAVRGAFLVALGIRLALEHR